MDSIPIPWRTTIINKAYKSVVNSWNLDITVATDSVIEGSVDVEWANVTANGTQSVPIGFVVQGQSGMLQQYHALLLGAWHCFPVLNP